MTEVVTVAEVEEDQTAHEMTMDTKVTNPVDTLDQVTLRMKMRNG